MSKNSGNERFWETIILNATEEQLQYAMRVFLSNENPQDRLDELFDSVETFTEDDEGDIFCDGVENESENKSVTELLDESQQYLSLKNSQKAKQKIAEARVAIAKNGDKDYDMAEWHRQVIRLGQLLGDLDVLMHNHNELRKYTVEGIDFFGRGYEDVWEIAEHDLILEEEIQTLTNYRAYFARHWENELCHDLLHDYYQELRLHPGILPVTNHLTEALARVYGRSAWKAAKSYNDECLGYNWMELWQRTENMIYSYDIKDGSLVNYLRVGISNYGYKDVEHSFDGTRSLSSFVKVDEENGHNGDNTQVDTTPEIFNGKKQELREWLKNELMLEMLEEQLAAANLEGKLLRLVRAGYAPRGEETRKIMGLTDGQLRTVWTRVKKEGNKIIQSEEYAKRLDELLITHYLV